LIIILYIKNFDSPSIFRKCTEYHLKRASPVRVLGHREWIWQRQGRGFTWFLWYIWLKQALHFLRIFLINEWKLFNPVL